MPARSRRRAGPGARAWRGIWRIADPKITLASAASMFLGGAAAARAGEIAWGWLGLTALGIFLLEAAKNASGEIFDFDSGVDQAVADRDRSPFSGGKRVLVDGLLTRRQTAAVAAAFYGSGIAAGLAVALLREPRVLWLGLAGVALAFFYHAPPLRLSYRGLGELAVAVTYGPLICCGTYLVQRGQLPSWVVLVSLPLGLLVAAFLWVNEFPDFRADAAGGKRTLVVRLGRRRASRVFGAMVLAAYAGMALLPAAGLPAAVWLGLAGLPHALAAAARLRASPETTARVVPAQAWTLASFALASLGVGLGLVLAGRGTG
ncbi:MAG TPA: prenyltransferase [Anaeromyxobacteraceae bacterium]|nr:prenyltransferase [Anaeromyxobacteraceae bacterium]